MLATKSEWKYADGRIEEKRGDTRTLVLDAQAACSLNQIVAYRIFGDVPAPHWGEWISCN